MANECGACGLDFGSVNAFDAHRVGKHEYTYSQGLKLDPPQEDGRRCLDLDELETRLLRDGTREFAQNSRGQWSLRRQLNSAHKAFSS